MQKVLLVAVAILFALGVLTSYQKHILDYRVSAITEIEFGQASAIEHREYLLRSCQSGVWAGAGNKAIERLTWSISSGNNYGDACQASLNSKGLTAQGWVATGSDACTEDNQICTVDNVRCFAVRLN
ncbi:TPA: hypothetical protein ACP2QI_004162 [Escherichia coli]|nr:hypothetical protein [Citrobacter freundii]